MNKPLRRVAIFCGLLVFALLLRDNWLQFVRADELNALGVDRKSTRQNSSHMAISRMPSSA